MDYVQDYLTLLPRLLPASVASPLLTFLTTTFSVIRTLATHLAPFLTRLTTQPDVASILLLVAVFFISLKILDMMYRAVMFWVTLVLRIVLYGGVVVLGLWVYNRGVDGFAEDVAELMGFWVGEYERFKDEVEGWREVQQQQVRFKAAEPKVRVGRGKGRGGWR